MDPGLKENSVGSTYLAKNSMDRWICNMMKMTMNLKTLLFFQHIQSNLDTILAKQPNALVIVTGDFNPTTTGRHATQVL